MNETVGWSDGVEPPSHGCFTGVLPLDDEPPRKTKTGPSDEEPVEGNQGAGQAYPVLVLRSDSTR